MNYRKLGRTGLQVSEIGLGGHEYRRRSHLKGGRFLELDPDRPAIVEAAIDAGLNYFDTTFTEEAQSLGAVLRGVGAIREKLFISGMIIDMLKKLEAVEPAKWPQYIEDQVKESLHLLQSEYFDLFQICAMESGFSPERLEGALEGLQRVKQRGLIRHIGASSHDPELLARVIESHDPFDVVMAPFNFNLGPCASLLQAVRAHEVGFVAIKPFVWFEYGVSFLSICRGMIEERGPRQVPVSQMALRWVLGFPEVSTVVPGVNSMEELVEDLGASEIAASDVDVDFLEACGNVPNRIHELVDLLAHPHEEVRTYAHQAVRDAVGTDFGMDREKYLAALQGQSTTK